MWQNDDVATLSKPVVGSMSFVCAIFYDFSNYDLK